jgi:hypothetical protein
LSETCKIIDSIWNKEELPDQWKESIIVPVHKKGDKTDCSNCCGISLLSTSYQNFIQSCIKVKFICRQNYWGLSAWVSK